MPRAPKPDVGRVLESLDKRLSNVEQILPTLATRDEMLTEGRETRRHFDVVAESIRSDIRLIAEGHAHQALRLDAYETKTDRALADLDRRVLRLEAKRSR